jgi:hypothetical protein
MLYRDLNEALVRAKERSGNPSGADSFMTDLLYASAGKGRVDQGTCYRPFYVAAKWLEQDLSSQELSEASGAKFTGLKTPIRSLLDIQYGLDQDLIVPKGFEIPNPNRRTTNRTRPDLEVAYRAAVSVLQNLQPRRIS